MTIKRMHNSRHERSGPRNGRRPSGTLRVRRGSIVVAMILVVAVLAAACGPIGGNDNKATKTPRPATSLPASPPATSGSPVSSPAVVVSVATPSAATPAPASPAAGSPAAGANPVATATAKPPAGQATTTANGTAALPVAKDCQAPNPLPAAAASTLVITDDGVNLRSGPGTNCDVVQQLDKGTQVTALSGPLQGDNYQWIKVDVDGTDGWMAAEFAKPGAAGTETPAANAGGQRLSLASGHPQQVAILMYHHLDVPGTEWSVTTDQFTSELQWLKDHGYVSITITQLVDFIQGKGTLPPKPVVISDDDGYPEMMRFADILKQYGFIGTYYIPSQSAMTADDIRALEKGGGEICGHTVDHANLAKLDWNGQYHEIADNKAYLEQILGHPVRCFAYPYGAYNDNTVSILKQVGYVSAVNVGSVPVQLDGPVNLFHLERVQALGGESIQRFAGYFPWSPGSVSTDDANSE